MGDRDGPELHGGLKHVRLRAALLQLMEGLAEDSPLPPERELCQAHGVSRQTVRQALQQLVAEGRVYRRQGSGTYVASRKIARTVDIAGSLSGGGQGQASASRLVAVERHPADQLLAAALRLTVGTEIIQMARVHVIEGEAIGVERVYVEAARFDGVWEESVTADEPLSRLFRDSHGLERAEADQTIEAVPAGQREAELLSVAPGVPLLLVSHLTVDSEGIPSRMSRSWYRGDRYRLTSRSRPDADGDGGPLVLRPARPDDAPVLAQIFVQAWRAAYEGVVDDLVLAGLDEQELAARFRDFIGSATGDHNAILAARGRKPVGFARFGEDPDVPGTGHVVSLYVTPTAMGQGVGRTLLAEVVAELRRRGYRTVTLWVFEANARARRLYGDMGFQPDGRTRVEDAYGAPEIRLRLGMA
jgi:GntR family transcriptional regulator